MYTVTFIYQVPVTSIDITLKKINSTENILFFSANAILVLMLLFPDKIKTRNNQSNKPLVLTFN
jgi:hypothetical protein